jgi:tripartite ATP-independent transporter DctM subunit
MDASHLIILLVLLGGMAAVVPIGMCLFFTAVVGFLMFTNIPLLMLAQSLFRSMDNFALVVVLYFIFCGNIMTSGKIVDKLIKFSHALVSWLPGGLAMAGCLGCGLFGAISGSTVATVVALGGFMIPALMKNKYPEDFTIGIMTSSPNLGIIIPPSISMILYCLISNVSLEGLFLTGFLPGIGIMFFTCLYTYLVLKNNHEIPREPLPGLKSLWLTFKDCFWALMLPVVIFGGIYSGAYTANESAVIACVYALIVELFIHKAIKLRDVFRITVTSAMTSGSLLFIVAGATCFGRYLTMDNIPARVTEAVLSYVHSPYMFLLISQCLLLVVGMLMDVISATLILGPVFLPMLKAYGIDLMHFGLLMTVNLAIGYITPPVGVSLYITGAMTKKDVGYVSKAVFPFVIIQIIVLFIFTYWEGLALWLPRLFGYVK